MKVQIKLEEGAKLPVKGEKNAMCYDCYAWKIEKQLDGKVFVDLGFSLTPPEGYGVRLIPRSNLTKYWWVMNNSIGVIDPDFKDNLQARFTPLVVPIPTGISDNSVAFWTFPYTKNDRICQLEIYKRNDFEFEIVDELTGEDRGGGFGSTGV